MANQNLKQHAHILDLLPDLIVGVDKHGVVCYVSKSVGRELRCPSERLRGASVYDMVTPETRFGVAAVLQAFPGQAPPGTADKTLSSRSSMHQSAESGPPDVSGEAAAEAASCKGQAPRYDLERGQAAHAVCSVQSSSDTLHTAGSSSDDNAACDSGNLSDLMSDSGAASSGHTSSCGELSDEAAPPTSTNFAAWSQVNLQRHNEEQNEQAVFSFCLIRSDRTTIWCEAKSNKKERCAAGDDDDDGAAEAAGIEAPTVAKSGLEVEVIFSLRPIKEGQPVPASVPTFYDKAGGGSSSPSRKFSSSSSFSRGASSTYHRQRQGGSIVTSSSSSSRRRSSGSSSSSKGSSSSRKKAPAHETLPQQGQPQSQPPQLQQQQQQEQHQQEQHQQEQQQQEHQQEQQQQQLSAAETLLGLMGK